MFELGPKGQEENPPHTAEPETKRKRKILRKRGGGWGKNVCKIYQDGDWRGRMRTGTAETSKRIAKIRLSGRGADLDTFAWL